jgi:hypothetical protein
MSKVDKRSPHARLTVEEVKAQYKAGLLTITGYFYNWLLASKREGWRLRSNVSKISDELGVSRSSFYKAISKLKDQGMVNFEIHGDIEIWIEDRPMLKILSQNVDNLSQISDSLPEILPNNPSQIVDDLSQNLDSLSQISDDSSQIVDSLSQIRENQGSKVVTNIQSGDSPDLIQISFNSYSSLSQLPAKPPALEREILNKKEEIQEAVSKLFSTTVTVKAEEVRSDFSTNQSRICEGNFSAPPKSAEIFEFNSLPDSDLLNFIQGKAPDNVRSPRAWARKCFTDDRDYWLGEMQKDCDRRAENHRLRNLPNENADCYRLFEPPPKPELVRTIGSEVARLQAKWLITHHPRFRESAIAEANKLGLIVDEQGIRLSRLENPDHHLSEWEAF